MASPKTAYVMLFDREGERFHVETRRTMVQRRRRLLEHPHGAQVRAVDLNLHAGPLPIHSGGEVDDLSRLMLTQSRASRYGGSLDDATLIGGVFGRCNSKRSGTLATPARRPTGERGIARRRVDQHGAEEALPVGEEERGDTEAACIDDSLVFASTSSLVLGSAMASSTKPGRAELFEERPRHVRYVGLVALHVEGPPGAGVPGVELGHVAPPEQRAHAHHGPAVGPVPLPGVLLALDAVDLLEAEEPPV